MPSLYGGFAPKPMVISGRLVKGPVNYFIRHDGHRTAVVAWSISTVGDLSRSYRLPSFILNHEQALGLGWSRTSSEHASVVELPAARSSNYPGHTSRRAGHDMTKPLKSQ